MSNELGERTIKHIMELYIEPEITRRRDAGLLPPGFELVAAQVIMNVGERNEVRLNDEIRAVVLTKLTRSVRAGEVARLDSLGEIKEVHLTDHDPNAGHATLIRLRDLWYLTFDFRYNAARVTEILRTAGQFLDTARDCLAAERLNPFCDTLYSAVELCAKGLLMLVPNERILSSRKHGYVQDLLNRWGRLGNVNRGVVQLLNQLERLRPRARYVSAKLELTAEDARSMLVTAEEFMGHVRSKVPLRKASSLPVAAPPAAPA